MTAKIVRVRATTNLDLMNEGVEADVELTDQIKGLLSTGRLVLADEQPSRARKAEPAGETPAG